MSPSSLSPDITIIVDIDRYSIAVRESLKELIVCHCCHCRTPGYNWNTVRFASNEGEIYESIKGSLVKVIYYSSSIQVYFVRQNGEYIYSFPKTGEFATYKAFSRDDAANYLTNYNKQLAEVSKKCPAVVLKIESGSYDLKSEKAKGHIRAIGDYETSCGSGNFERTLLRFQPETIINSYK